MDARQGEREMETKKYGEKRRLRVRVSERERERERELTLHPMTLFGATFSKMYLLTISHNEGVCVHKHCLGAREREREREISYTGVL